MVSTSGIVTNFAKIMGSEDREIGERVGGKVVVLWGSGCCRCFLIEDYRCCRSCEFRDVSSWRKESKFIATTGGQRQVMKIQSREEKGVKGCNGKWEVVLGKWGGSH